MFKELMKNISKLSWVLSAAGRVATLGFFLVPAGWRISYIVACTVVFYFPVFVREIKQNPAVAAWLGACGQAPTKARKVVAFLQGLRAVSYTLIGTWTVAISAIFELLRRSAGKLALQCSAALLLPVIGIELGRGLRGANAAAEEEEDA